MPSDWNVNYNDRRESPGSRREGYADGFKAAYDVVLRIDSNEILSDIEKIEKIKSELSNTWLNLMKQNIEIEAANRPVINRNLGE